MSELLITPAGGGTGTGDVTGPGSSVDSQMAVFSGTTGKTIKVGPTTGDRVPFTATSGAITTDSNFIAMTSDTVAGFQLGLGTSPASGVRLQVFISTTDPLSACTAMSAIATGNDPTGNGGEALGIDMSAYTGNSSTSIFAAVGGRFTAGIDVNGSDSSPTYVYGAKFKTTITPKTNATAVPSLAGFNSVMKDFTAATPSTGICTVAEGSGAIIAVGVQNVSVKYTTMRGVWITQNEDGNPSQGNNNGNSTIGTAIGLDIEQFNRSSSRPTYTNPPGQIRLQAFSGSTTSQTRFGIRQLDTSNNCWNAFASKTMFGNDSTSAAGVLASCSVELRDNYVAITDVSTTANELRFYGNGSGSAIAANYVSFKAGALSGNTNYVLPLADGTAGQLLSTNASGTLSWTSVIPSSVINLTGQVAAIAATTIVTPSATGAVRVSVSLQITTAATTSSVLGGATGVVLTYTDGDNSVAQSITMALFSTTGTVVTTAAGNTTTTNLHGSIMIYAKTGVAVQLACGYTSVGATPMAFAFRARAETL